MADWNELTKEIRKRPKSASDPSRRRKWEDIVKPSRAKPNGHLKALLWDVLYWECGFPAKQIARTFGVHHTTVNTVIFKDQTKIKRDRNAAFLATEEGKAYSAERVAWHRANNWDYRFRQDMNSLSRQRPEYKDDIAGWTDEERQQMSDLYRECAELNERDGARTWHVDHIIPYNVGGRHIPSNCRVILGIENQSRPKNGSDLHQMDLPL